jgi:hypothetical protein
MGRIVACECGILPQYSIIWTWDTLDPDEQRVFECRSLCN